MNELVNDGINLSKLEINTSFINGLPKKWLSFCQSLRNTNHVKDSELASLFGKLKYEENLIDSIYETQKEKSFLSATPSSIAFFSTSIVQDFQDSPDDEEDTRSSHEYLNDLEEYQERALLAKTGHFARDYFAKTSVPFYQSPFHSKQVSSSMHKPELRPTKDFKAKYNKVKAKLALLSSITSPSKSTMVKNKVKVLMALAKDNDAVSKEVPEMVNGYLHKYIEQPGHKVVFRDDSTCVTEGYGSIKCNGIVFTKVAFVNGLKYNLIDQSTCDAKYIVQFDKKKEQSFTYQGNCYDYSLSSRDVLFDMTSSEQESCFIAIATENLN
ncbi:hypothetical protein Tco_0298810 [Tanacetum coccineum]